MAILARKCKAPQVVGEILAGLIIGPCVLGIVQQTDFIVQMAEIGVILLILMIVICYGVICRYYERKEGD